MKEIRNGYRHFFRRETEHMRRARHTEGDTREACSRKTNELLPGKLDLTTGYNVTTYQVSYHSILLLESFEIHAYRYVLGLPKRKSKAIEDLYYRAAHHRMIDIVLESTRRRASLDSSPKRASVFTDTRPNSMIDCWQT